MTQGVLVLKTLHAEMRCYYFARLFIASLGVLRCRANESIYFLRD